MINRVFIKVLGVFFLGVSSGLPLALTSSLLTAALAHYNVDVKTIGALSLIYIPYSFKFLWAFLVDKYSFFPKKLGFRRGWILIVEIFLAAAIVALGVSIEGLNIPLIATLGLSVVFLSASHDIVIDAYRIELLSKEEQSLGVSSVIWGYRVGMLISGGGGLMLAHILGWEMLYSIFAAMIFLGYAASIILREPDHEHKKLSFAEAIVNPFKDFMIRPHWLLILVFAMSFKLPDAVLGSVANKFYIDMGFSMFNIGSIVKTYGFAATMAGMAFGGWLMYKIGSQKSLIIALIAQALTNLCFMLLINHQGDVWWLGAVITVENFAGSIGNVILVAYVSNLCNFSYVAAQYALFSSATTLGRTLLASYSGVIVADFGWEIFFIYSCVLIVPALVCYFFLYVKQGVRESV